MKQPRRIDVPVDRLERWIAGFAQRHGESTWSADGAAYLITGVDGSWARMTSWNEATSFPPDLPSWTRSPKRFAIILIRRGGYAVGCVEGDTLVAHKCGTRYVQSRTAAGGWSQQRYARRRSNQADALVEKTGDQVHALLSDHSHAETTGRASSISKADGDSMMADRGFDRIEGLVVGGNTSLAAAVLRDRRLAHLADLSRREFFDIPDPRRAVLHSVAHRARSVSLTVSNT